MTACTSLLGETSSETSPGSSETGDTSAGVRPCVLVTGEAGDVDTGALSTDALYLSGELFVCANDVVVVDDSDLTDVAVGAQLAASLEGPLLFPDPRLAAELGRLKPERVHLIGALDVTTPPDAEILTHSALDAANAAGSELGVSTHVALPASPDASTLIETVAAIAGGDRVVMPATPVVSTTGQALTQEIAVGDVVRGISGASGTGPVWVVAGNDHATLLLAAAMGHRVDATIVAVDGTDVLAYPEIATSLDGRSVGDIRFIGAMPQGNDWELSVLANGRQLPGGGFHILPDDRKRRYVALYGHPGTDDLGALGEQGPEATLERLRPFLEAYAADGSQVIPSFEIVASVASGGATDDGDYSYEWPSDTFTDWVAIAEANDVYVILDLQPGRDDFLTQAKLYEDLLLLPHVGLALDPEWRLTDTQVHLQQVGSVDAAEVNQVIGWLADLVHDNGLPQKMLVLHQFKKTMIRNRETLVDRPELQVVVQMDGDGTEAQKDSTLSQITAGAKDAFWSWGWKNFFDEDEPGPPSPESTIAKTPPPVYVSYQ